MKREPNMKFYTDHPTFCLVHFKHWLGRETESFP